MARKIWIAVALLLGAALTATAGYGLLAPSGPGPQTTQTQGTGTTGTTDARVLVPDDGSGAFAEFGGGTMPVPLDNRSVTLGLAVRWGYLNDPAVAALEGGWRWNDNQTGGGFLGRWQVLNGRIGGLLEGRFTMPSDGKGSFQGAWHVGDMGRGGALWGAWVRLNDTSGVFDGRWNVTGSRVNGTLAGRWQVSSDLGGSFRGLAVAAPSLAPVRWDGSLTTSDGIVRALKTVRFEPDDHLERQTDNATVSWVSTTTVNWDGILFGLRIPKNATGAQVTLQTPLASFTWNATDIPGLRVRQTVDAFGHEIQVVGFVIGGTPRPPEVSSMRLTIRWGILGANETDADGNVTAWNGFAQITDGGLQVVRTLSFERGDYLLPRDNRQTVEWVSHTSTGWDGVALVAAAPTALLPHTYVTVHAGTFTQVFAWSDLPGTHVFDVGGGNQVEIVAARI